MSIIKLWFLAERNEVSHNRNIYNITRKYKNAQRFYLQIIYNFYIICKLIHKLLKYLLDLLIFQLF